MVRIVIGLTAVLITTASHADTFMCAPVATTAMTKSAGRWSSFKSPGDRWLVTKDHDKWMLNRVESDAKLECQFVANSQYPVTGVVMCTDPVIKFTMDLHSKRYEVFKGGQWNADFTTEPTLWMAAGTCVNG